MKEFDHEKLDDIQTAFLTRLRRMHLIIIRIGDTVSDRNELMKPIIPHLHQTHRDGIVDNAEEFATELDELGETVSLMSDDIDAMGSVVLDHMKYLETLVDEIKDNEE